MIIVLEALRDRSGGMEEASAAQQPAKYTVLLFRIYSYTA